MQPVRTRVSASTLHPPPRNSRARESVRTPRATVESLALALALEGRDPRLPQSRDRCDVFCCGADGGAKEIGASFAEQLRMAAWLGLLSLGWLVQKGLCMGGMPSDCASDTLDFTRAGWNWTPGRVAEWEGLRQLLTFGFFAGWLHGVHHPKRFRYLMGVRPWPADSRHIHAAPGAINWDSSNGRSSPPSESALASPLWPGVPPPHAPTVAAVTAVSAASDSTGEPQRCSRLPWYPVAFLLSIPLFTWLTELKAFERSLSSSGGSSLLGGSGGSHAHALVVYIVSVGLLCAGLLILLIWHCSYGWRHCGGARGFLLGYLLPRLLVLSFFAVYMGESLSMGGLWVCLSLGWLCATQLF
jgi:hypothetical protein